MTTDIADSFDWTTSEPIVKGREYDQEEDKYVNGIVEMQQYKKLKEEAEKERRKLQSERSRAISREKKKMVKSGKFYTSEERRMGFKGPSLKKN